MTTLYLAETRGNPNFAKLSYGILAGLGAASIAGFVYFQQHPGKATVYEHTYTDKGKCLDNTPYDFSNNAGDTVKGDVLTIIPEHANSLTPSVLSFTVDGKQIHFADHQTGSFLVEAGCIDANSGQ